MDFETYQSPFSWRYGSRELRHIWSEVHKRQLWREIWLAVAELQMEQGLVSPEQVVDLRGHVKDIDIPRALEIESQIQHDVMAEIQVYAEQCRVGEGSSIWE
jgi:adenylosuccinate lyase